MFPKSLRRITVAAIAFTSLSAAAQEVTSEKGLHFVANAGFSFGGDTIAVAQYTDNSSQKIKAGGMFEFGAGAIYEATDLPLAAQLTANYHVDDTDANNGTMRFHRFPIEASVFFTGVQQWRFGLGVRAVQSPRYVSQIKGAVTRTFEFNNTTGALAEVGYAISPKLWVNLRYVSEKYTPNTYTVGNQSLTLRSARAINGNHVAISTSYQF